MKKLIIFIWLIVMSNFIYAEATTFNAQHRLPPVIYSLDIPHTIKGMEKYKFKWSVMGYHDDYDMKIGIYKKKDNKGKLIKIFSKIANKSNTQPGGFSWGDIRSNEYFFEADVYIKTLLEKEQDLYIRFFISPPNDDYSTEYLSCLIPSGLGYRADGTSGRIIKVSGIVTNPEHIKDVHLNPSGTSYIMSPGGYEQKWKVITGSTAHSGVDLYSDDWNWKTGNSDNGKIFYSSIGGEVIFTGIMYDHNDEGNRFDSTDDAWFGNQVIIYNERTKMAIRYAHLSAISVNKGDKVYVGQELGKVGNTGRLVSGMTSMSPHLHMTLYKNISETAYTYLTKGWWPHSKNTTKGSGYSSYITTFGYVGDK